MIKYFCIPGFDKYKIDIYGNVFTLKYNKVLKPANNNGYKWVNIVDNFGNRKHALIHRLVAMVFIDNPSNKPEVNHKDGNKANNHVSNLEWCTKRENMDHAIDSGLIKTGERHQSCKISKDIVRDIRIRYRNGDYNFSNIARDYKLASNYVRDIVTGVYWGDVHTDLICEKQHTNQGSSSLTFNDVIEIRKWKRTLGVTNRYLASIYGITTKSVSEIINYKTWSTAP